MTLELRSIISINRAVFHFNGNQIVCKAVGVEFDEFRQCFPADERAFGFVRVQVSHVRNCAIGAR